MRAELKMIGYSVTEHLMAAAASNIHRSAAVKIITVAHNGVSHRIALVPDLPVEEINQILKAQFALEQSVVALVSARRDAVYPLSLLSKSTSLVRSPSPLVCQSVNHSLAHSCNTDPLGLTTDATYPLLLSGAAASSGDAAKSESAAGSVSGGDSADDQDSADEAADENELFEYHAVVDKRIVRSYHIVSYHIISYHIISYHPVPSTASHSFLPASNNRYGFGVVCRFDALLSL